MTHMTVHAIRLSFACALLLVTALPQAARAERSLPATPQSVREFNVNFAALLPIFDVLGGTYRPARPGERPATGLDTGDLPREALEVALWPVRGLVRRRSGRALRRWPRAPRRARPPP